MPARYLRYFLLSHLFLVWILSPAFAKSVTPPIHKKPKAGLMLSGEVSVLPSPDPKSSPSDPYFKKAYSEARLSLRVGRSALEGGQTGIALPHFHKAARLHPQWDLAHYYLGETYRRLKQNSEAMNPLLQSLVINPDLWEAHLALGHLYEEMGKPALALRHYDETLRLYPNHAEANLLMGVLLESEGKHKDALKRYRAVVRAKPKATGGWYNLARAYGVLKKYKDAVEVFQKLLRLDATHAEGHMGLAMMYLQLDQFKKAEKHFSRAKTLFEKQKKNHHASLAQQQLSLLQSRATSKSAQNKSGQ